MIKYPMVHIAPVVSIRTLHEPEASLYEGWSAQACLGEVERLRQQYIQWKYPHAEPRLQRVVAVVQRPQR